MMVYNESKPDWSDGLNSGEKAIYEGIRSMVGVNLIAMETAGSQADLDASAFKALPEWQDTDERNFMWGEEPDILLGFAVTLRHRAIAAGAGTAFSVAAIQEARHDYDWPSFLGGWARQLVTGNNVPSPAVVRELLDLNNPQNKTRPAEPAPPPADEPGLPPVPLPPPPTDPAEPSAAHGFEDYVASDLMRLGRAILMAIIGKDPVVKLNPHVAIPLKQLLLRPSGFKTMKRFTAGRIRSLASFNAGAVPPLPVTPPATTVSTTPPAEATEMTSRQRLIAAGAQILDEQQ